MFSCGYNGWMDAPEEEREALDRFEAVTGRAEAASLHEPMPAATPSRTANPQRRLSTESLR
jgi:ferric-dicitrate binding protein FerR (iron transport regulator)